LSAEVAKPDGAPRLGDEHQSLWIDRPKTQQLRVLLGGEARQGNDPRPVRLAVRGDDPPPHLDQPAFDHELIEVVTVAAA